jgi:Flp pilus assembly protein TadB
LRYDVNARLDIKHHHVNIASVMAESSSGKRPKERETGLNRPNARDRMIDSVLKALALTALASIAIGAVRWLVRRPTALLVVLMILGASTLLMH